MAGVDSDRSSGYEGRKQSRHEGARYMHPQSSTLRCTTTMTSVAYPISFHAMWGVTSHGFGWCDQNFGANGLWNTIGRAVKTMVDRLCASAHDETAISPSLEMYRCGRSGTLEGIHKGKGIADPDQLR